VIQYVAFRKFVIPNKVNPAVLHQRFMKDAHWMIIVVSVSN